MDTESMTQHNDPQTPCDKAAHKYLISLQPEVEISAKESFKAGWSACQELMQSRISELEDRLRWVSQTLTITEENEEKLEAKLAICKNALERIANGGADNGVFMNAINRHLLQCDIASEALAQLEGKAE